MRLLRTLLPALCAPALLLAAGAAAADLAFKFVPVGGTLPRVPLERVGGGTDSYLGGDAAAARLFAFVKADQDGSAEVLDILAGLKPDYAGRPVHFALIISGRSDPAWADSVAARCAGATVLLDREDALYGALGVPLTPVVGIGDGDGVLRAYLTYRKVHYRAVIDAHLKHVLGDATAEDLAKVLAPSGNAHDSARAAAARKLKLARMLLSRSKTEPARTQTEAVLAEYPDLAEAHRVLAEIRRAEGDEAGAAAAEAAAAALDATEQEPSPGGE